MQTSQMPAAPSLKAGATTNKQCNIVNNTDADIVVLRAFTDEDLPTHQLYEQLLKLSKTTDGREFIKAGDKGTFVFDQVSDKTIPNIIIAKSDNLSPVKVVLLTPDKSTQAYPDVTVTAADIQQMKLAAKFMQSIIAFPSSSLATDFTAALSDADTSKVDAFLKATEEYPSLTLDAIVAVQTYYAAYPFVWAFFKADQSYRLYSSDGKTNTERGEVTLLNECTAPVHPDKPLAGFTITYTIGDSSKPLYYVNGQFVDDVNSNKPGVCLQGLFMVKSQLTEKDTDTAMVCTLTGTVEGISVIGLNQGPAEDGKKDSSDKDILHFPEDAQGWIALSAMILVGIVGIGILAVAVKTMVDFYKLSKNPPTAADIQAALRERIQGVLDKIGDPFLELPTDVAASLDMIKAKANEALLQRNKTKLRDIVDRQSASLQKITEFSNNADLQSVYDKLSDMNDRLLDTQAKYLGDAMKGMLDDLKANAKVLNTQANKVKSQLGKTEKKAIDDSKEAADKLTEEIEENERAREELREDEIRDEAFEFLDEF